MAIILPPETPHDPADAYALESVVLRSLRPAYLLQNGRLPASQDDDPWSECIEGSRRVLEAAARGVARVETDGPLPFVGSAFLVSQDRAVTASFVAESLAQHRAEGEALREDGASLQGVWLNFAAERGSDRVERVAVREVRFVHPYWGFAFLILDRPTALGRVLRVAAEESEAELTGRDICVIGYPSRDVRNEPEVIGALFQDVFDVKRLMPGKITGASQQGAESWRVLTHDATTTGGTSGAPLLDMRTGEVIAVHLSGRYLVANYATPAWEILRDPQWWPSAPVPASAAEARAAGAAREAIGTDEEVEADLTFEEVLDLHRSLVRIGFAASDDKVAMLLGGLPTEFASQLMGPGGAPAEKLLSILQNIYRMRIPVLGKSAFYFVVRNAAALYSVDPKWKREAQDWIDRIERQQDS